MLGDKSNDRYVGSPSHVELKPIGLRLVEQEPEFLALLRK
jgi:hypothetical protein